MTKILKEEPIIKAIIKLHYFVKNNPYPKKDSEKFFEFLELLDDIETILREEKYIK